MAASSTPERTAAVVAVEILEHYPIYRNKLESLLYEGKPREMHPALLPVLAECPLKPKGPERDSVGVMLAFFLGLPGRREVSLDVLEAHLGTKAQPWVYLAPVAWGFYACKLPFFTTMHCRSFRHLFESLRWEYLRETKDPEAASAISRIRRIREDPGDLSVDTLDLFGHHDMRETTRKLRDLEFEYLEAVARG